MTDEQVASLQLRWKVVQGALNEAQRRLFLAAEARALGEGGESAVARALGVSRSTVRAGLEWVDPVLAGKQKPEDFHPQVRVRRPGAGRKSLRESHPELVRALFRLVDPGEVLGTPAPLLWSLQTREALARTLAESGIRVADSSVFEALRGEGFRVQASRRPPKGAHWPDASVQFGLVNQRVAIAMAERLPVASLDLHRIERSAVLDPPAPSFTAGLRSRHDDRFANELSQGLPKSGCHVCGATAMAPGELKPMLDATIDLAALAVQQWLVQEYGSAPKVPVRAVLVVSGMAGEEPAMRRLAHRLEAVHEATRRRLEVLHLPMGISRWRVVERRFSLAVNDLRTSRVLERHEGVLEIPGRLEARARIDEYVGSRSGHVTNGAMGGPSSAQLFSEHPTWNYSIPSA